MYKVRFAFYLFLKESLTFHIWILYSASLEINIILIIQTIILNL